jgi:hypothetical protein
LDPRTDRLTFEGSPRAPEGHDGEFLDEEGISALQMNVPHVEVGLHTPGLHVDLDGRALRLLVQHDPSENSAKRPRTHPRRHVTGDEPDLRVTGVDAE